MENEEAKIVAAYGRRDEEGRKLLYSWQRPEVALQRYRILESLAKGLLNIRLNASLDCAEVLDIGCGNGWLLRTLAEWDFTPGKLHGVDLLEDRIRRAISLCPSIDFRQHSGWALPFDDESMDIVIAMTVFSSVLSPEARENLAKQMRRVLRPGGVVVIFDFLISSPRNPDTIGIGARELRRLFPSYSIESRRLILAPPLQRPLAKISPWAALTVEYFVPLLRTHAFHFLQPKR